MANVAEKVQDLEGGATEMVQAGETSDWDSSWEVCNFRNTQAQHPQYYKEVISLPVL